MGDALIRQYYASFNERRIADAPALFSRDATVDHPPFTGALRGGDAYEQFADTWLRAFPDARLSVEHVGQRRDTTCEVDLVAIGTHRDVLNVGAHGTLTCHSTSTTSLSACACGVLTPGRTPRPDSSVARRPASHR